jgi:sugar-phosphatase
VLVVRGSLLDAAGVGGGHSFCIAGRLVHRMQRWDAGWYDLGMIRVECRGILFDLDGVLIDSNPAVDRVWNGWAAEHGFEAAEVIRRAHGRPSRTTVREYLPAASEALVEAEHQKLVKAEVADVGGIVPLPGVVALLNSLTTDRWAIVTSGTYELATTRIRAAGIPWPKNLVTASDIKKGKPDPEPYLKGAALLGLAASDCVVMEDADPGILAGKAAGARVIGVRTPTVPDAELIAAGADWMVDNLADVTAELDSAAKTMVLSVRTR